MYKVIQYNSTVAKGLHVCVWCGLQENPYVMLRPNYQELEGNDRYEGFCVDMLKELADILKFKYRIRLVGDGVYGVSGANGTWTGMVGELMTRVSFNVTKSPPASAIVEYMTSF